MISTTEKQYSPCLVRWKEYVTLSPHFVFVWKFTSTPSMQISHPLTQVLLTWGDSDLRIMYRDEGYYTVFVSITIPPILLNGCSLTLPLPISSDLPGFLSPHFTPIRDVLPPTLQVTLEPRYGDCTLILQRGR